ncbi:Uncharacterised protein [Halioglobus japonicus]|nr:Uncharacterised protein [Halioglobus japonicus]
MVLAIAVAVPGSVAVSSGSLAVAKSCLRCLLLEYKSPGIVALGVEAGQEEL